jgi:hypothetical protein
MAYIGSTPTTQSFIAGTDSFNGTGSQTDFTLSRLVNSTNDIQVVVNNVVQYPPNYSVSGTTLTISPAPSSGTNNVYVRYLSTTLQSVGVGDLSVSTTKIQDNAITTAKIAAGAVIPADLSTGAPAWDSAGVFQFNSGYGSVATVYGCRAWVNFNGTGTVAIRASGNVSSITDNGTGNYTVNLTNAMPDANYSPVISVSPLYATTRICSIEMASAAGASEIAPTTNAFRFATARQDATANGAEYDPKYVFVSIFR